MGRIVLASASPRRRELLMQMGVPDPVICPADADESVFDGCEPGEMVVGLAGLKASAVKPLFAPEDIIVGSDTAVVLDGKVLGKPRDECEAAEMLRSLSGRAHSVLTGLCVMRDGKTVSCCSAARVVFRELSEEEIAGYVSSGEPMDKAGAYGIQGRAAVFAQSISGDYYSIVGLPVCRLAEILKEFGVSLF